MQISRLRQPGFLLPAALLHPAARIALVIGLAERIFWGMRRQIHGATGEAAHVAVAWAQGRGFADAFMPGQGPTAHLLPVTPLIGGIAYRLFGVESMASEIVLFTLSQVMVFGAFLLLAKCFERLGSPPRAILAGFCLLCLLPIYTTVEAFDFRIWEGAYGLALGALALLVILAVDAGEAPRRATLWLALLPPVTFFVNPAIGVCAFAALALMLWRRRARVRPLRIMTGAALILAVLVGPWMARNMIVMHHPIPLRDNVGLELAVGNFPAALAPGDFDAVFETHLQTIHPRDHPAPFGAMVAAGGEVAYAKLMGERAKAWIAAHPSDAARLWIRHVREMLFTRTWMFQTAHGRQLPVIRATLASIVGVLGLVGLIVRAFGDRRSWYVVLYIALPVLFYFPFQPIMRYTWLLYPVMMYFAADMVGRLVRARRPVMLGS
jgi:hypothetical protein